MKTAALMFCLAVAALAEPCRVAVRAPSPADLQRVNHHTTGPKSPAPEPGQGATPVPSLGVRSAKQWYGERRPELLRQWTRILGKLEPAPEDRKWFGDVTKAVVTGRQEMEGYTRLDLDIPIETDFYQRHLLLLPKGQGAGPFPAVIAWTSSTPDYREPEAWWGAYLARRGYVVLTSWSFIRNYRQGTRLIPAIDLLYERFGHWLGMGKMVHDVRREAEFLRSRPEVDAKRIGFIGFSLGAKAAVYVGAFVPEIQATVAVDPHIAINGTTNWYAPWYLDWKRRFDDIRTPDYARPELRGTVESLLNPDAARPGFEHDHHELLALAAPRAFLLIGGGCDKEDLAGDSDDRQSWAYFNRAKEVFTALGVPERLQFACTADGHHANGKDMDPAWQSFFDCWLKSNPVGFEGYSK
jgi:dienelactone hydrolase